MRADADRGGRRKRRRGAKRVRRERDSDWASVLCMSAADMPRAAHRMHRTVGVRRDADGTHNVHSVAARDKVLSPDA